MVPQNSPVGKPPLSYKEVLYWKISEAPSRLLLLNVLPILLGILFGTGFYIFIQVSGGSPPLVLSTRSLIIFLIGTPIILAIHEFVHGIMMQLFGAKPRYGFWMQGLMFYAKAPGYIFQRNQYALMVLAPLLGISVLICLGIFLLASNSIVWVPALWAIVNASAANVNIWIMTLVSRYPGAAYVVDEQDGMRILLLEGDAMSE